MEDSVLIDKILHRDKDAEEIFQDTLLAFLEALRDFQGECAITTFLYSIGRHKIIDYYRKKKIRHLVFSQAPFLEELVSPILNPEEELDAVMLKEKLKQVFSHILPRYALVLKLKYIDDFSVWDIANRHAWSLKKTESLLSRARKAFIKEYSVL
jgi:RNA polymerase sigma-70 factor (ECF subfamily)